MKLGELLKGIDLTTTTTVEALEKAISDKATELKSKVLIDDGKDDVYIPKHRLDDEINKRKTLQTQYDDTNKTLEEIKKSHKDDSELSKTIENLQKEKENLDSKLKQQSLDSAIKLAAISAKSLDTTGSDVLALIDKSKLTVKDDGTVDGLDTMMKTLQESKPYLFGEVESGGTGKLGKGKQTNAGNEGVFGKSLAEQQSTISGSAEQARESFFK